jgi:hypothetical protein
MVSGDPSWRPIFQDEINQDDKHEKINPNRNSNCFLISETKSLAQMPAASAAGKWESKIL